MMEPMSGDRIRFKVWELYRGESVPDIPVEEYTGSVVEAWGIGRVFLRVKRDHDKRKVIMFMDNVDEILERKRDKPTGPQSSLKKFAAAAHEQREARENDE